MGLALTHLVFLSVLLPRLSRPTPITIHGRPRTLTRRRPTPSSRSTSTASALKALPSICTPTHTAAGSRQVTPSGVFRRRLVVTQHRRAAVTEATAAAAAPKAARVAAAAAVFTPVTTVTCHWLPFTTRLPVRITTTQPSPPLVPCPVAPLLHLIQLSRRHRLAGTARLAYVTAVCMGIPAALPWLVIVRGRGPALRPHYLFLGLYGRTCRAR